MFTTSTKWTTNKPKKNRKNQLIRMNFRQLPIFPIKEEPPQLFIINRNNNRQQRSPFKQILRLASVPGTDRYDPKRPEWQSGPRRVICHNCYQDGHYAPDCTLKIREYPTISLNFEKLNTDDKARVSTTSYTQARSFVEADAENKIMAQVKQAKPRK